MSKAVVLTISDSSYNRQREDRSGPAVQQRLAELGHEATVEVLPDERAHIARRLSELCDGEDLRLIFTTGGTGVALRDVTPEATKDVIEREVPGLSEWIRMQSRGKVPTAILSRGIAGTRKRTLILNLPGSPRGAVESLDFIADVLTHVIDLLEGRTEHRHPGGA